MQFYAWTSTKQKCKKKKTNEKQPLRMIVLTTDKNAQREIGGNVSTTFFTERATLHTCKKC